jgi:Flp pilus assembly pilin Flp
MSHVDTKFNYEQGQKIMLYLINRFFCKNEVGAAGVEYALLIGIAALAIIAGTIGLSGFIEANFQTVTDAMTP